MIKALCLGAKGVGMGRPFLYSLTYGEEGVVHAIESKSRSLSTIFAFRLPIIRADFVRRGTLEHRGMLS